MHEFVVFVADLIYTYISRGRVSGRGEKHEVMEAEHM